MIDDHTNIHSQFYTHNDKNWDMTIVFQPAILFVVHEHLRGGRQYLRIQLFVAGPKCVLLNQVVHRNMEMQLKVLSFQPYQISNYSELFKDTHQRNQMSCSGVVGSVRREDPGDFCVNRFLRILHGK